MAGTINAGQILANEDAIAQIIEHGESLVELVGLLVVAIGKLKQNQAAPATPVVVSTPVTINPAAPTVQALENMDAEQLVATRKNLADGVYVDAPAYVAEILERRLGSSKP